MPESDYLDSYVFQNYEGPLSLLLQLVLKSELDICDIPVQEITSKYITYLSSTEGYHLSGGAEFLRLASYLIQIKSRRLLPLDKEEEEEDLDDPFAIVQDLLEYYQYKKLGSALHEIERKQKEFFPRGWIPPMEDSAVKRVGDVGVSIDDLAHAFRDLLARAPKTEEVHEEPWQLDEKMKTLELSLLKGEKVFTQLFHEEMTKAELVVTFLALLELLKRGLAKVRKENDELYLMRGDHDE